MAWALQFNGVDESVNIPCATGSATISIKLAADIPAWGGSDEFLFDGRAGTSTYYLRRSGSALRLGISNYKINNISVTADAIFNAVAGDVISFTV
ncbi:MAG: hypothetical protein GY829_05900, partial [Gammaproteobacteria bacterium]|nr:hypothetical protein [Gammaproteobacteria bacterium]